MRIVNPVNVKLIDSDSHPLEFESQQGGRFRVSVLEHDLIRVQHFPDGVPRLDRTWQVLGFDQHLGFDRRDVPVEGRNRDDLSSFSLPRINLEIDTRQLKLQTELISLEIETGAFQVRCFNPAGRLFHADRDTQSYLYDQETEAVYHYLQRQSGEYYFGFGERSGPLDKAGRRMRMLNVDCLGYDAENGDPLYKHFPFYITYNAELDVAYGLFYDNLATTVFDLGCELNNYHPPYRYYQADGGDLDYYLIYGPTIPDVVRKFATLTGRMSLPPRWSLGYLGSTMTYTEAPDAQEQLKQFVDLCEQHQIPCDLFHLSSGYTTGEEDRRYVFNWNLKKVPDPKGLMDYFHKGGIKISANIKPALLTSHPRYEEVNALGAFVQDAEEDKPQLSAFWGGFGAHVDFTNPAGYDWWQQRVLDRLLAYDIDSTWNDNNEFALWDDAARCHGFGDPIPLGLIRPLQPMLMSRASRSAQLAYRPSERPFLISRSGCPGIQRYAQTWSGDNYTSWKSLRYNIPMGLGMSLSGAPNTGHDVGGFAGPKPDAELFVRWVQNGIFHPRFTIHSWNDDGSVNEPWMYPEFLPIIQELIEFRYRLIPYLYSLFFQAAMSGDPIIRPLVYHFPDDPQCRTESFDFLLGESLLVASVLEQGARTRNVYLPPGEWWCDFYSGEWFEGGQTITVAAPLDRIPLFVRAGGIIPLGKVMRHFDEQPDDSRQLYVFPHPEAGRGVFNLIEDDGVSFDYLEGGYAELEIAVDASSEQIEMQVEAIQDGFALSYRRLEIILPESENRTLVTSAPEGLALVRTK